MLRKSAFLLSVLMLVTGSAAAQEQKKRQRGQGLSFEQLDKNKDGFLDQGELPERVKGRLERIDQNSDGKVSREEWQRVAARFGAGAASTGGDALFRLLDKNSDGKLSREELQDASKLFEKLDKNKDGALDRDEVSGPDQPRRKRPGTTGAAPVKRQTPAATRSRPAKP